LVLPTKTSLSPTSYTYGPLSEHLNPKIAKEMILPSISVD